MDDKEAIAFNTLCELLKENKTLSEDFKSQIIVLALKIAEQAAGFERDRLSNQK